MWKTSSEYFEFTRIDSRLVTLNDSHVDAVLQKHKAIVEVICNDERKALYI